MDFRGHDPGRPPAPREPGEALVRLLETMDVAAHDGALVRGSHTGLLPCGVAGEQLLLLPDNTGAVEGVLLPGPSRPGWKSSLAHGATTNLTRARITITVTARHREAPSAGGHAWRHRVEGALSGV